MLVPLSVCCVGDEMKGGGAGAGPGRRALLREVADFAPGLILAPLRI
jgi:hypothetical protein